MAIISIFVRIGGLGIIHLQVIVETSSHLQVIEHPQQDQFQMQVIVEIEVLHLEQSCVQIKEHRAQYHEISSYLQKPWASNEINLKNFLHEPSWENSD
ncbi:hypothetical protein HanPI659440_Chr05g0184931 [Helianthus annuus]|nr:hypothetical protein HanPI659440_Chr05g0184931 [Helianthus annuus]